MSDIQDPGKLAESIEALGKAWEEFKTTNEQKIAQAAKGAVDPLITQKLEQLNAEIEKRSAERDAAIVKSVNRLEEAVTALKLQGAGAPEDPSVAERKAAAGAFTKYLRRGEVDTKAMSATSDPDGGYTVHPDMGGRIVTRIFETSPIRQEAAIVTISTDRIQGLKDTDQAGATWVGEVPSGHSTATPQLGLWTISVNQLAAEPTITQVLLEDTAFNVDSWLEGKLSDYFMRTENTAFVTGDGQLKPRGFASYSTAATADASRSWGTFEHLASGTSGGFGTDPTGAQKLISLVHKLNPAYLGNAKFYMNRSTLSSVRQLTDASSQGKFIFVPSFQANMPDTVLGYPVVRFEDMADVAADSLSIAFGDMRETYTIVDRVGISVLRDPLTSKGNVKFYTRKRVGGDVVNFNSLKFMKFAA